MTVGLRSRNRQPSFSCLLGALLLDLAVGEPPARLHPVVWIGAAVARLEAGRPKGPRAQLRHGMVHVAIITLSAALAGVAIGRATRAWSGLAPALLEVLVLKTTFSLRGLVEAARCVERSLDAGDLDGARVAVRALVSRDPSRLDGPLLASATVESLAENLCDSLVAPLLYYVLGGLPAALAFRAVNTMDAMIGYRGEYEHSGKAAARLDDLLNFLPARLSGGLLVIAAALAGGDVGGAWRTLRRDHGRTASPNAGWPMSAMAGALGVCLEKPGVYRLAAPLPPSDPAAIDHAIQILRAATLLSLPAWWALARARRGRHR